MRRTTGHCREINTFGAHSERRDAGWRTTCVISRIADARSTGRFKIVLLEFVPKGVTADPQEARLLRLIAPRLLQRANNELPFLVFECGNFRAGCRVRRRSGGI